VRNFGACRLSEKYIASASGSFSSRIVWGWDWTSIERCVAADCEILRNIDAESISFGAGFGAVAYIGVQRR